jgi:hypothetical protein
MCAECTDQVKFGFGLRVEEPQEVIERAFAVGFHESAVVNWERKAQSILHFVPINSSHASRRRHSPCEFVERIRTARVHPNGRSSAEWRKRDVKTGPRRLPS